MTGFLETILATLLGKEKRTSIAAVILAVMVSAGALYTVLDGDPDTIANMGELKVALAAVGITIPAWLMGRTASDEKPEE